MPSNGFPFLVSLLLTILSLLLLSSSAINSLYLATSPDSGDPVVQNNGAAPAEVPSLSQIASTHSNPNQEDPFLPIEKSDQLQSKNNNDHHQHHHHNRYHTIKLPTQTPLATKFVLLTTGDQIKLYPFLSSSSASAANELFNGDDKLTPSSLVSDQLSSEFHYVVKPFQFNTSDQTKLNHFGNSTYMNWLQEQANINNKLHQQQQNLQANNEYNNTSVSPVREQPTTRASILPRNADTEESAFRSESGWRKPLIIDVDYFIDERFCGNNNNNEDEDIDIENDLNTNHVSSPYSEPKNDEIPVEIRERQSICLVIVWLDANNHFIHFGSIDLAKNPLYQQLNKYVIDEAINDTSKINNNTFIKPDHNQQNQLSLHGQKSALLHLDEFPPIDIYKSLVIISDFESIVLEKESKRTYGMIVDHKTNSLHVAFSDGSGYPNRILSGRLDPNPDWSEPDYQLVGETIHSFNDCPNLANANQELINLIVDEQSVGNRLYYFDKTSSIIYVLKLNKKNFIDSDEPGGFAQATQALVRNIPSDSTQLDSNYLQQQQQESQTNMMSVNYDSKLTEKSKPMGLALNTHNNRLYWLSSSNQIFSCDRAGRDVKLISQLTMRPAIRAPIRLEIFGDKLFIVDSFKWSLIEHNLIDDVTSNNLKPTHKVLLLERYGLLGVRFVYLHNPIIQRKYKLLDPVKTSEDKIDPFDSLLETSPTCVAKDDLQTTYFSDNYKYYLIELLILYIVFIIWLSLPWVKRKLKK